MRFARLMAGAVVAFTLAAVTAAQGFNFEQVRGDFFAGISGDAAAMQRGLASAKAALEKDPKNAQALVVHGFGTVINAAQELQKGNMAAMSIMQGGFGELDEAVHLAPDDGLVRVLRGIMMQQATRQMPDALRTPMLEKGRSDFQFLFDVQQAELAQLGTHRLGELLQALGDIHSRLGRTDDAERYYRMVTTMLPETEYARRAAEWLNRQPLPAVDLTRALTKLERIVGVAAPRADVAALLQRMQAMLAESQRGGPGYLARVASRTGDRVEFVDVADVTHFYAKDKLTFAVTPAKHHALDLSITDLETRLPPQRWLRVHRATLLNIDAVKELYTWFGGKLIVRLKDGTELQVARDRAADVRARLGV